MSCPLSKKTDILQIICITILLSSCNTIKQGNTTKDSTSNLSLNHNTPPGTIQLEDNLYIDKTPVTNLMFMEFLKSLDRYWNLEKHDSIQKMAKYGFDGSEIKNFLSKNVQERVGIKNDSLLTIGEDLNFEDYINDPFYDYHPVIQITKAQAQFFCLWRTDMVMLSYAYKAKNPTERKKFPSKVNYRLPAISELKKAVETLHPPRIEVMNSKMNHDNDLREELREFDSMVLFNISEYTLNNKIYGANWRNKISNETQNDYTGFRCICEVEN
ncbi:SUMF1/EgtB/PvdO family nonheme iron enzyme [Autumnicola musiva]|uniref:SUMF1/EgtB/PvdO family nonheme iron enzyme n=1 Tax=Autumnicola musiva TaxID=3075589 RepID=A0ABU3D962_9FLAO|nr:SUMF1/EgtB/PvdO family nonheme iron enzyme [Zunongwangia sp. F117]MDT0678072.1 SUMF1/EgtB/PvdO family nonheme iron enzyme [Zunongwangia sp. F117]